MFTNLNTQVIYDATVNLFNTYSQIPLRSSSCLDFDDGVNLIPELFEFVNYIDFPFLLSKELVHDIFSVLIVLKYEV